MLLSAYFASSFVCPILSIDCSIYDFRYLQRAKIMVYMENVLEMLAGATFVKVVLWS